MSISAIETAMLDDFAAMTLVGVAKVYPNVEFTGIKPYAAISFVHADPEAIGLKAPATYTGLALITVVTELGLGVKPAANIAALIAARYPYGRRLNTTGGLIEIPSPPFVMEGFRQDADWRLPVRVPYWGFLNS